MGEWIRFPSFPSELEPEPSEPEIFDTLGLPAEVVRAVEVTLAMIIEEVQLAARENRR